MFVSATGFIFYLSAGSKLAHDLSGFAKEMGLAALMIIQALVFLGDVVVSFLKRPS